MSTGETFCCAGRIGNRQRGVALILVLWMLVLLTVIANSLVFASRTELLAATHVEDAARAESVADAGVALAAFHLQRQAPAGVIAPDVVYRADGLARPFEFAGLTAMIAIAPEAARIDLNTAPATLLAGLFVAVGLDAGAADGLVDAIADWRDADTLRRLQGAEAADYAAAGRLTRPANADFSTTLELRDVLGVDEALYTRLAPFVTVHSRAATIDTTAAAREVLLALPGVSPQQVDAYIAQRDDMLSQGLPAPPFTAAQALHASGTSTAYHVRVTVVLGDNSTLSRHAVVQMTGNPQTPVAILDWRAPAALSRPTDA